MDDAEFAALQLLAQQYGLTGVTTGCDVNWQNELPGLPGPPTPAPVSLPNEPAPDLPLRAMLLTD